MREQMLLEHQMEGILQKKINKPSPTQPVKVQEGSNKSLFLKVKKDSAEPPEKTAWTQWIPSPEALNDAKKKKKTY